MKNLIFTGILSLGLAFLGRGQSTPTLCDAPDSIKALYQDDADWLALQKTLNSGSTWQDSAAINPVLSDVMMESLIAVYNATTLKARDTVVDLLKIHSLPNPSMKRIVARAEAGATWLDTLMRGYVTTGDITFDSIITAFNLVPDLPIYPPIGGYTYVELKSDKNWNAKQIAPILNSVDSLSLAFPAVIYGGPIGTIEITQNSDTALITYSHGWNIPTSFGCYTGCPYRRYWQFQVDLSDCSVQYLGSYGDVLPQNYFSFKEEEVKPVQVYPNPFNTSISLENVANGTAFYLYAYNGQLVREGLIEHHRIANLQDLPTGVYLLKVGEGQLAQQVSLVKQ